MKKILFVVLFIVFLVSPSHAFNPLVVCAGQPVASGEDPCAGVLTYWDMSNMVLDCYDADDGSTVSGSDAYLVTTTGYNSGPGIEITANISTVGDRPRFTVTDGNGINAASIDVRFWYKETDAAVQYSHFFRYGSSTEFFARHGSNDTNIDIYYGGTTFTFNVTTNVYDGSGHWIRIVVNATTDSHAIYIEDTEAALTTESAEDTDTTAITAPTMDTGPLFIGESYDGASGCEGIISEFSIR